MKKCLAERKQWDWELISKACDYVRSKLFLVCTSQTETDVRWLILALFLSFTLPLLSRMDLTQSVTNTVLFNLFSLSFLLLSRLRRLTHTSKHTVSTTRRQSGTQPVNIMQKHTHSAVISIHRPRVFHFQTGFVAQLCLLSLSPAFFNCLPLFSSCLTNFSFFLRPSMLHWWVCIYVNCCCLFLTLPLPPWTWFTPAECSSWVYLNTHALSGGVGRAVVQTDGQLAEGQSDSQ